MFCWLIVLVVFLVIEIITLGLTTIWFAVGALLAFFAAWLGAPEGIQLAIFFVVSFVLLFFTRPLVQKKLNDSREKTNVNSMIGKEGKVLETIDNFNGKGRILVGGMEWTARALEEENVISEGAKVTIQEIRGVKAIVTEVTASQE
jgi:membrane protein implicated in regulation of membrane protease activity